MAKQDTQTENILARISAKLGKNGNKAIAEAFGITQSAVTNWKTRGIPIKKLQAFAAKYNVPLNWLLYGDEKGYQSSVEYEDISLESLIVECIPDSRVYFSWAKDALIKKDFEACRTILKRICDIFEQELIQK